MSNLSTMTKSVLGAGALVGLLGFFLIAELGLNAGLVHHGVTIGGYEVSGLTLKELEEKLEERGALLRASEVCFARDLVELCVDPMDIGWRPEPGATALEAFEVGRADLLVGALRERITAWVDGVNVQWKGGPNAARVTQLLDRWETDLAAEGLDLKRGGMRYKIRRAIVTFPRRTLKIPIR